MTPSNLILHSRPRAEADWECARKRFYLYEWDGTGLSADEESLEMFRGTSIHDGLAAIANLWKRDGKVDIDLIATTAFKQVHDAVLESSVGTKDDVAEFAKEQGTLVEGLMRGFYRHQWPTIVARWPRILAIETDVTYYHDLDGVGTKKGPFGFMAKPDLVVESDDGAEKVYLEYKSTSNKKDQWINSWDRTVQVHATREAIAQDLGIDCTAVVVQGLYTGYESYGKLASPMCLAPGTRVLTADMRWVPIGSVAKGDKLAAFDENRVARYGREPNRYWQSAEVLNTTRERLPSSKVTFSDGTSVVCSNKHLWLTSFVGGGLGDSAAKWLATDSLRPATKWGQRASRVVKLFNPWEQELSYEAGYLAGALDGEGHLTHTTRGRDVPFATLGFSQKPGQMLDRVTEGLRSRGFNVLGPYDPKASSAHRIHINRRAEILELLGTIRPERLLAKLSLDDLGLLRTKYDPVIVMSVEDLGEREVVPIETSTRTLIAEGLATHNCYAYHRWGNPPFTQNETLYEYRSGFKRYPVWNLDGGVKKWVDEMPLDILMEQFPQTPLIFPTPDDTREFFAQRALRELEIRQGRNLIKGMEEGPARTALLRKHFPQTRNKCKPAWGYECPLQHLCFGSINDPLKAGMSRREPHHQTEVEMNEGA